MSKTNVEAGTLPQDDRPSEFSLDVEERSIADGVRSWVINLRSGNPGALPSVLGLVVLGLIFMQVSSQFLTKYNLGNIPGQGAYIAVTALGLVFVLLLGEIDLSAATAGGTCAVVAAVAVSAGNLHTGLPTFMYWCLLGGMLICIGLAAWLRTYTAAVVIAVGLVLVVTNLTQHLILALIAAVCIGTAIGVFNGYLVAKVGIPSFVVTLALFLAWQGVEQFGLKGQPVNTTRYDLWHNLTYGNLSVLWSWIFIVVVVGGYAAYTLWASLSAKRAGLARDGVDLVLARAGIIALVAVVVGLFASVNRNTNIYRVIEGVPVPAVIAIVLMIGCTIALTKTTWGRHLYATGGNIEAARRAGIDVVRMKVNAFTLCSAFGALGGIMLASSQSSASLDLGAGNALLFSVAAAVIGGTSLFGGRGKPRDAIIGALVITIIPNGLGLRASIGPQWQQVITGIVLLLAAAIDAVSRKRAARR
ncbi:ABC transporter permease [Nocardioides mangrovicus]|uniref:Xylose transport system permease protein XylH n=1 Tax=Nocardioides mangrovicus TaxID=2478913 RepID=A0A3L8P2D6_9ACTN|nr:ABC transporter permease [Nocardioides mangrovicus]RLV49324.1 ABC transporter permease [Nocardioides mangrovicus]